MKTDIPELPLLFTDEMIRALLEGRKTETRRVLKLQPLETFSGKNLSWMGMEDEYNSMIEYISSKVAPKPPFKIWAREAFASASKHGVCHQSDDYWIYRATDPEWSTTEGWKWTPSILMPRAACRIELICHEFRVERLQEITDFGSESEGMRADKGTTATWKYMNLWDKINGKKHPWSSNPFVRVYAKLERVK